MRRECVFPSIEWVLAIHTVPQGHSVIEYPRLPPTNPVLSPATSLPTYRRYESYMWGYSKQARTKKPEPASFHDMIQLTNMNPVVGSLDFVEDKFVVTHRPGTADSEYTTNIASLNFDIFPEPEGHPAPGLWSKVRKHLGSFFSKIFQLNFFYSSCGTPLNANVV